MSITRRSFLVGTLALPACARVPASPNGALEPITLDQAFSGRAIGAGVFRVYLTGTERRFTARLQGRLDGDRLTVVEDFSTLMASKTFGSGNEITRLGFEDVIYFDPDGRVINDAVVTRFGIPVERVRFEM